MFWDGMPLEFRARWTRWRSTFRQVQKFKWRDMLKKRST
jgi:hypothetical protein